MTAAHQRPDLSVDQDLALRTAAVRLTDSFRDVFGVETIERFPHSSYDDFANRATIPNRLPLLAERFARQRLQAVAEVEGRAGTGVPTVLFLCTHDAGRSQMAMGSSTHLAGTTGCGDACAVFPGRRYSEWILDDPEGMDVAAVRPVRDEIERRVRVLLDELGVTAQ